jgi:hypothetical protein
MKALEFQSSLNSDGSLRVPIEIARSIPPGQPLRVLVLLSEGESDEAWENLAAMEFGQGYAESDAIYDQLSGR